MRAKLAALVVSLLSCTPSLASFTLLESNSISNSGYNPETDFGKNGNLAVSTDAICYNDYVIRGYGCISGELEEFGIFKRSYVPGIDDSQLIYLSDDNISKSVYLYIFRNDLSLSFDKVSLSQSLDKKIVTESQMPEYNEEFNDYNLKLVSTSNDGYFLKYKIDDIDFSNNNELRRYMIRQIFNSSEDTKSDIMKYIYGGFNEYFVVNNQQITKNKVDLLLVKDKFVGFDVTFKNNNNWLFSDAVLNSFVFFNTDLDYKFIEDEASLIGAVIEYDYKIFENVFIRAPAFYVQNTTSHYMDEPLKKTGFSNVKESAINGKDANKVIGSNRPDEDVFGVSSSIYNLTSYSLIEGETIHENILLEPEVKTFSSGVWYNWFAKVSWNNMGRVSDNTHVFSNKFLSENKDKFNWYINFDNFDTYSSRLYVQLSDGTWADSLVFNRFKEIYNTTITSLKFKYAESVVREFITVDTLTDSSGYFDILNKETDDSKISLIISFIVVALVILAIVLCLIFIPGLLPILLKCFKICLKIVLLLFEFIIFIPYLILVLPFQAIHAKRTNTKLKVWNPFKL